MPMEFKTAYCPRCDEDIQAERESPSWVSLVALRDIALLNWLLGSSSDWTCSQCGAAIPIDPEERKRQRLLAIYLLLPLAASVAIFVYVLIVVALGE
jgi:hypothetical protein